MDATVLQCVNSRLNFFGTYVMVPAGVQPEVDVFTRDILALGESCSDATEFEAKFASSGLSDRFNAIITKCVPIEQEMTDEQKAYSKQVRREMYSGKDMAKDIAKDVADTAAVEAVEELIAVNRERMIERGSFDEYTRVSNVVDDVQIVGGWLGKMFKKKKKK